jgi:negative regulator of sigma E activity|tara:strand:- start:1041 stop:1145 length:105 start_codon:yes stop_codon:yes gene_type:complete
MDNENLKRIADALEEILRLVKKDMDRYENRKDIK